MYGNIGKERLKSDPAESISFITYVSFHSTKTRVDGWAIHTNHREPSIFTGSNTTEGPHICPQSDPHTDSNTSMLAQSNQVLKHYETLSHVLTVTLFWQFTSTTTCWFRSRLANGERGSWEGIMIEAVTQSIGFSGFENDPHSDPDGTILLPTEHVASFPAWLVIPELLVILAGLLLHLGTRPYDLLEGKGGSSQLAYNPSSIWYVCCRFGYVVVSVREPSPALAELKAQAAESET